MKMHNGKTKLSMVALAVASLLNATPARADDAEAQALMKPTSSLEIGAVGTSATSAKFGEYTGLNKSGGNLVGNLGIRGGTAYDNEGGTSRWSITGRDLGLTSQSLNATFSEQGQWSLGFGYDELRHNLSDTYQTPYLGSMGGNTFTLPAAFTTAPLVTNTTTLNAAQQAALRPMDISTTRKNTSLNIGYAINPRLNMQVDYNHLDQSGAKLMAFGSMSNGGASGEVVSILPNPTNYQTDTMNLALNWAGDKGHMSGSYFGSFFREGDDRVNFQTFVGAANMQAMSTAPGNIFHQLNLSGGYAFTPKTKLSGGISYGLNTQNDAFVVDPFMYVPASPATGNAKTSLNGLVQNTHADMKLTDQTTKDLTLSGGLKYDRRDNRTSSNIYNFYAIDGGNAANYPNTPLSFDKAQLELAGDYRMDKSARVRLAYNREDVKRWCNDYAVGGTNYPAGANCVVATNSKDDKLSATYKRKVGEDVDLNVGYSYSDRKTTSDQNAIAALISVRGGDVGTTVGTIKGLNGGDYIGFHPFFDGSRKQQMIKAGSNWQANEKLSFGLVGRYTDDQYDSTYGVQKGNSWSLNLDATYSHSEDGSVSAYLTQQNRERALTDMYRSVAQGTSTGNLANGALNIPAGATWTNQLKDQDITFGLGAKQAGLMGGKLALAGDLTYSLGTTGYGTQFNYATTNINGLTCSAPQFLTCGQLPDIKSEMLRFKLTGIYAIDKSSKVAVTYMFQQLTSSDYYYNGLQYGNTANTMMPTNQQAPNYVVNLINVGYVYNF